MTETRRRILIVDDEPSIRDSLKLLLQNSFEVTTAEDGEAALISVDSSKPDLVLLDVMMPKMDGLTTLKELRSRAYAIPIVMLTGANTVKTAVEAMKCGAVDYISKPFEIDELTNLIISTLAVPQTDSSDQEVQPSVIDQAKSTDFGLLVGQSPVMTDMFQKVEQVAERDATILITGESGTGKELIAKRIHELSKRSKGPFIPLHCAAVPESLIESELFGHEKGSFTSAIETRLGQCELANGGTLFLDEIGELSLQVQVKLLRFLQEQEFYRIGRSKPIKVNVRIIAATNRNLEQMVKEKKFRQDLYYRINVIGIDLPPLRDRYEDIPRLMDFFIEKYASRYDSRKLSFTADALDAMVAYGWPGNVRELENVVESLLALSPSDEVTAEILPRKMTKHDDDDQPRTTIFEGSLKFDEAERLFETEMILKALKKTNFVQTRAAELLGISRRILKYKMDKLGISDSGGKENFTTEQ